MNKREFKDNVYSELAMLTRSMANPHRLEIIELLAQGEYPVEQIAEQTDERSNWPQTNPSIGSALAGFCSTNRILKRLSLRFDGQ